MTQNLPFFSIIIPTYNRPERLAKCLGAIATLDFDRDRFEVIVVDDGSDTPLDLIVRPFQEQLNLTLIRQPNGGPAKARNTGVTNAKCQFLAFTDDDCTPDSNWLTALEKGFLSNSNVLLGGKTINSLSDNPYSTASQLLIDYIYSYYNSNASQAAFFASNNLALPRDKFLQIDAFDTTFPLAAGEDRELCARWLNRGYQMQYIPEAIVYHSHYLTLASFWRQHFNYGRGAFHFHQLRASRQQEKIKVEPLPFYWRLLTFPFGKVSFLKSVLMSVLLFFSQVANVMGFFREKTINQSKELQNIHL